MFVGLHELSRAVKMQGMKNAASGVPGAALAGRRAGGSPDVADGGWN